ncbi:MAG: putative DNA-binding domain-containing protein [Candidatus Competibacteraceae bacterium]|nr:putative DNA-binding domain-containing protein [Candidatus Competibacteraceae bacterium]
MLGLRELQLGFANAVLDGAEDNFDRHIRAAELSGVRRLQVYRNNTLLSLTGALEAVYPVVRHLVGEEFFRYAAAQYIARHPSRSGDLHEFGEHFPLFLQAFAPAADVVYLPEVARLEWAYHQVFHAADHRPLDVAALAQVPVERQGELRFELHPAARLLESAFPILRIWQVNQDDEGSDATVDLREGGVKLLVIRRENLEIEFQPMEEGAFHLLQALAGACDFAMACEWAMAAQPTLDLPACFHRYVSQGVLTAFYLPDS